MGFLMLLISVKASMDVLAAVGAYGPDYPTTSYYLFATVSSLTQQSKRNRQW